MNIPKFVRNPSKATVILGAVGAVLLACLAVAVRIWPDPEFVFLNDRGGAKWIYHDYARSKGIFNESLIMTPFRTEFLVSTVPDEAVLEVQALKSFQVRLDGLKVRDFQDDDPLTWKETKFVDLAPHLKPGYHVLEVIALNQLGPAVAWARCPELNIYTSGEWTANVGGNNYLPAKVASAKRTLYIGAEFGHVWHQLRRTLHYMVPLFALSLAFVLFVPVPAIRRIQSRLTPSRVRWLLLGLLLLLGLNNMFKIHYTYGFDAFGHYAYVEYVVNHMRIPLAHDGWQMFQSPFFYMLSAPVHVAAVVLANILDPRTAGQSTTEMHFYLLRIVPILCGLAHIEISYRMVRLVWPEDHGLQIFGTLFGGLIPANIYMSQFVGNEPMVGLAGGIAVLLAAHLLKSETPPTVKMAFACGAALGLALLSKVSAALLLPPCLLAFSVCFIGRERALPDYLKKLSAAILGTFIVCGWYYLRNWILVGRLFVGGWDPARQIEWWQAPGYRMWNEYFRFGEALSYPLYSGMASVWDGVYSTFWLDGFLCGVFDLTARPPWNSQLLGASAWLAVLPTLAILFGAMLPIARMLRRPREPWTFEDRLHLFAVACVGIYLMAIVYMHLRVPVFSGAKGSYLSAVTACIAYLATRGYAIFRANGRALSVIAFAWFTCWFFTAYATYFVVNAPHFDY